MRDRVLLLVGVLGQGPRSPSVPREDRVVAEPVVATRFSGQGARAPGPRRARRSRPGRARTAAHTKAADRCSSGTSADLLEQQPRLARSRSARARSVPPVVPDHRALNTPGEPPRTSTARPESSASAGRPVASARATALSRAFPREGDLGLGHVGYRRPRPRRRSRGRARRRGRRGSGAARAPCARCGSRARAARRHVRDLAGASRAACCSAVSSAQPLVARSSSAPSSSRSNGLGPRPCPAPRRTGRRRSSRRSCRCRRSSPRGSRGRAPARP